MNFREQVDLYRGAIPAGRIQIKLLDDIDMTRPDPGVIIVFATWSGSSVVSFRFLCEALLQSPHALFPIYVVDADTIEPEAFVLRFGKRLNGNGETLWIKNGRLLHFDIGYTDEKNQKLQDKAILQERVATLVSQGRDKGNV